MNAVVLVQARTSSSRLPAKSLLPIAGMPLAVLACRRASNAGHSVVCATSVEESDDALCRVLEAHDVSVFRGSLNDPLTRFVDCTRDFSDDTILVRLTADNIVPDGHLIDELLRAYVDSRCDYLYTHGSPSGLPYGVSAEVMRVVHLREASAKASSQSDREHVTPFIRTNFDSRVYCRYSSVMAERLTCTIDTLDDYLKMEREFSRIVSPVQAHWKDVLKQSFGWSEEATPGDAQHDCELVLGGAQLGSAYGIRSTGAKPSQDLVQEILETAQETGIHFVDTAAAYGDSEGFIGQAIRRNPGLAFRVLTKLPPEMPADDNADQSTVDGPVERAIRRSSSNVGQFPLHTVMLHRASHMSDSNGAIWSELRSARENGLFGRIGVSVQNPAELAEVCKSSEVSVVQMPFNLLDYRWTEVLDELKDSGRLDSLEIHVRSVFLQGLLLSDSSDHWLRAHVDNAQTVLRELKQLARAFGYETLAEFALAYVAAQTWVTHLVIGVDSSEQVQALGRFKNLSRLEADDVGEIRRSVPAVPESTLNPSTWLN